MEQIQVTARFTAIPSGNIAEFERLATREAASLRELLGHGPAAIVVNALLRDAVSAKAAGPVMP